MRMEYLLKRSQLRAELPRVEIESRIASLVRVAGNLELEPLRVLLDRHFDGAAGLVEEFPLLIESAVSSGRGFAWRDPTGNYVAHAAWRPVELVSRETRLSAAGIGLVTTHSEYRERGLASALVEGCVQQAREQGAELALLFSAPRRLYARLGFVEAGSERIRLFRGVGSGAKLPTGVSVRNGGIDDAGALLELLRSHPLRVERSLSDLRRLLAIPHTHVHVAERENAVVAYCIEGKGRDLRGVVHEWAGETAALEGALETACAAYGEPLWVLSPASEPAPFVARGRDPDEDRVGSFVLARSLVSKGRLDPEDSRSLAVPSLAELPDFYVWGLDSV